MSRSWVWICSLGIWWLLCGQTVGQQGLGSLTNRGPMAGYVLAATPVSSPGTTKTGTDGGDSQWISLLVSVVSLAVSGAVAYTANFRKAEIRLLVGRNIVFFSIPESAAGVGFEIPVTFHNWSPQGGTIHRMRLVISKQGQDDRYHMAWTTFVKIGAGGIIEDEALAQPIPVSGRSSVNKFIRFDWTQEEGGKPLELQAGNYDLNVYAWTNEEGSPSFQYKVPFVLKDDPHVKVYQESVAKKSNTPIWVSLSENDRPNQVFTEAQIREMYSSKKKFFSFKR